MPGTLLYRLIGDGSHIEVTYPLGGDRVRVDDNGDVEHRWIEDDEVAEAAAIAAAIGGTPDRHERHGSCAGRHEIEVQTAGGRTRWVFECDRTFPHPLVRRMYRLALAAICSSD